MPSLKPCGRKRANSISCADESPTNTARAQSTAGTSGGSFDPRLPLPAHLDQLCLPLLRCARGELPANIALVHLFMQARDGHQAGRWLDDAIHFFEQQAGDQGLARLRDARALWDRCPDSFALVKNMLQIADRDADPASVADPAFWTSVFNRAADISPEA